MEVLVSLLAAGAWGPREGRGQKVTWGGRQHHSPVTFHAIPLPEVQGEDLTVEHRPLWESIWETREKQPSPRRPSARGGTARGDAGPRIYSATHQQIHLHGGRRPQM